MRPGAEQYAPAAPSAREREAGGRPTEQPRGIDPESSLPFLPAREPPNPTAGFSFHPAANRSSWRRGSHVAPWESPGGGDGGGGGAGGGRAVDRNDPAMQQHYAQHAAYFDSLDRPRSTWNSPGGGGGGGGGIGGGDYPGGRRYRDDFRGEERGQERGRGGGVVEWHLPHGEQGEPSFRDRQELPPHPHAFDRRHQPVERPLAGGGREVRHDEGRGGEILLGAPGSAPRNDRGRQQMFVRAAGGGGDSPYEHAAGHLGWPGDQQDIQQQRSEHGRHGPAPSRQDWEVPHRDVPLDHLHEGAGGGGGGRRGGGFAFQWESERGEAFASAFNPNPFAPEARRRGGENSRVALPASSSGVFEPGRPSCQEEGEEGGRRSPAAPASAARAGGGQSDEQEPQEMEEEREDRHRCGREQVDEGGEPASPRAPASGDHPAP